MSGHNKWSKIKHKKAAGDAAKSKLFSRLASEISIAARSGSNPDFNPALRSAIDRARKQNMPHANIERAIKKAEGAENLEPIMVEIYGPGGIGILVEATTDNKNRTMGDLRSVLKEFDLKVADPGSLMWSFERTDDGYKAKFSAEAPQEVKDEIFALKEKLEETDDVVGVYTSID